MVMASGNNYSCWRVMCWCMIIGQVEEVRSLGGDGFSETHTVKCFFRAFFCLSNYRKLLNISLELYILCTSTKSWIYNNNNIGN